MTHEVLSFPGTDRGAGKAPCARESDRIATAIVGLDGTIQNVNSVFTEILGRSRSELAGASWHDVLHPDECDGEAALFVDLLACAEESVRLTRRLVVQDGAICRGDLKLTALCDGAGEPNGILAEFLPERSPAGSPACKCGDGNHGRRPTTASIAALSRCISQGRQSDHSATPSRQVTRKGADRSHGAAAGARRSGDPTNDLVALMNHEFRTPLNAIIGFAEMLDREMLGSVGDTRYRQYARHIQESGLRLLSFVTDMLDLVSYEHGGVQLHDEVIDPVAPVSASVARAKDDCRSDRVVLSTHVAVDGTRLLADSGAVSRVLSYLIANAIDACGDGDGVTIAADATGDGLTYTVEVVRGDGTVRSMVRGSALSAVNSRGLSGLGMPLCNWLMRLHGGSLAIEQRPNSGSAVVVRFPESRLLRATRVIGSRAAV